MKWLLILLIPLSSLAQDSTRREHKWLTTGICIASVVAGGIGDGMNSRTKYTAGHILSAVSYATLIALPFTTKVTWRYPVTYLLVRYAMFDAMYNVGAHRNLNYMGGKNYYDESVGKMPLSVLHGSKVISLGVVVYLNRKK
jgi:hypothetical protein